MVSLVLVGVVAFLLGTGLGVSLRPCRFCRRVRHAQGCLLRGL